MRSPRLAWCLAASLALHLCGAWLLSTKPAEYLTGPVRAVTLTVVLPTQEQSLPQPIPAREQAPAPPGRNATPAAGTLTQKPRFLVAPDLSPLEEISVPFSGSLTVRLYVSPQGTVDRITVIKSDPVPKELLDGLLSRFEQAQLAPARAGPEAVASTLDLVIRYDAGPAPLRREP